MACDGSVVGVALGVGEGVGGLADGDGETGATVGDVVALDGDTDGDWAAHAAARMLVTTSAAIRSIALWSALRSTRMTGLLSRLRP
jgi:hypothetical protein